MPSPYGDLTRGEILRENEYLRNEVQRLKDVIEKPEPTRWPEEPPIGTVLSFEHIFPRGVKAYHYAALRIEDGTWRTTGREAGNAAILSWKELEKFIGPTAECKIATRWFAVPALYPGSNAGATIDEFLSGFQGSD